MYIERQIHFITFSQKVFSCNHKMYVMVCWVTIRQFYNGR